MTTAAPRRELLLALGSNLDDPLAQLRRAAVRLSGTLEGLRVSGVYRTAAEGNARQPDYLNAVVAGTTERSPWQALELARSLEARQGRVRPFPGAPRTLDVDLLFLGELIVETCGLTVPHPRWATRDFVVVPLLDVAPEWRDPATGRTVAEIARERGWDGSHIPQVLEPGALLNEENG